MENKDRKENDEFRLGEGFVDIDISKLACMAFIYRMFAQGYQVEDESSKLTISSFMGTSGKDIRSKPHKRR